MIIDQSQFLSIHIQLMNRRSIAIAFIFYLPAVRDRIFRKDCYPIICITGLIYRNNRTIRIHIKCLIYLRRCQVLVGFTHGVLLQTDNIGPRTGNIFENLIRRFRRMVQVSKSHYIISQHLQYIFFWNIFCPAMIREILFHRSPADQDRT